MDIKKLKETVDVQGLLENYEFEQITDDGDWVKARCPYHDDSSPSFCIRKSDTYFHCWSCKENGDAVKLIMDLDNVDFKEATTKLTALCGYSENSDANMEYLKKMWLDKQERLVDQDTPPVVDTNIIELHEWANQQFRSLTDQTKEYLKSRSITNGMIHNNDIGNYPDNFIQKAEKEGFNKGDLRWGGFLVGENDYEIFSGRLMFPIYDLEKRIRAFSGRTLTNQEPKYIATPNSDYYKKSYFLLGLQNISNKKQVIIVEGNVDRVRLKEHGFNTLAQLGSVLTFRQCELLRTIHPQVTLLLDGDEAGRKAMLKAILRLAVYGIRVCVVELPDGNDPDTFILKEGPEKLRNFMRENYVMGMEYYLANNADRSENKILCEWLKIVSVIKDLEAKNYYIDSVSRIFAVSRSIIESELKKVVD